jgi:hypothetical protein
VALDIDPRHTFASTLLSRGVSVKAVADWLGHGRPVTTLRTYAHLMPPDEDASPGGPGRSARASRALRPARTPSDLRFCAVSALEQELGLVVVDE